MTVKNSCSLFGLFLLSTASDQTGSFVAILLQIYPLLPLPPDPAFIKEIKDVVMVVGAKWTRLLREKWCKEVEGERTISEMEHMWKQERFSNEMSFVAMGLSFFKYYCMFSSIDWSNETLKLKILAFENYSIVLKVLKWSTIFMVSKMLSFSYFNISEIRLHIIV